MACYPPIKTGGVFNTDEQSPLVLWQAYRGKKEEVEILKDKLKQTLDMLEYAHITSETKYDYKSVSNFITETHKFLEEDN